MKKKILFLLSSLKFGGAEKHTIQLINRLDRDQFTIGLCYLEIQEDLLDELSPDTLSLKVCCQKNGPFELHVLSCIRLQVKHFDPDIVVCVDPYPGFYAQLGRLISKSNFKLIHILHQTIIPSIYNELIVKLLYRHTINLGDLVVFVCDNQMAYWIDRYKIDHHKCKRIYNGVDTQYFQANQVRPLKAGVFKPPYSISEDDIIIGICAVLRPEKRHTDLLEALKKVVDTGRSAKLLIIGDGPERTIIQKKINTLNLNERVYITGFQKDVRPYIATCHIMATTSVAVETFSIAILEAMAMGKPILASNIGGASEQVVEGVNGYTYPAGNIDALARQLDRLMDRATLYKMGLKSRKFVVEKFSDHRMIALYNDTLEMLS